MRLIASVVWSLSLPSLAAGVQGQTVADLLARADSLYEAGAYLASGRSFDAALAIQEGSPDTYYNAACSWALAGDADRALGALARAGERGYRNADWMNQDADLASLRDDPRWDDVEAAVRANLDRYLASVNAELYAMFQADQADRRGDIDWAAVSARDEARRQRARELIQAGEVRTCDDFIHAAFIFQHGGDSTAYALAHELSMQAVALDTTSTRARWIAAASRDRYLHSVGKPQIFGTQYHTVDGVWTMDPYDTTAVTDAERAWWGVPPLARQKAREREMNGH